MFLVRDFRHALRALWKSPGFSLISIAVLALGIGANAAIFSVVYAVILRPLPYPDASQLVFVWQRFPTMPAPFSERMDVARRNYLEWQRQNTVFQEMGAFRTVSLDETRGDFSQKVSTSYVSASLFHLLGTRPHLGRLFAREDEQPGRNRVAILADRYFDHNFNRDRNTLGKSVTLDGRVYTIIGVLPASFEMPHTFFDNPQPDLTGCGKKPFGFATANRPRDEKPTTRLQTLGYTFCYPRFRPSVGSSGLFPQPANCALAGFNAQGRGQSVAGRRRGAASSRRAAAAGTDRNGGNC